VEFSFPPHTVTVNMPTRAALMAEVARRFARGEGFALATINLDHLVKLRRDPVFAAAYAAQDLVVADGNPIVWLSRLARKPVELVPGSDLILPLAQAAAAAQVPVVLLGATDAALSAAAGGLRARVPGLTVAACIAPPMGFDPDGPGADEVLDRVGATGARLVFLALGAPKQERLAARGRAQLPGVGFASIGAGLDFIAGTQTRAPVWVRAVAMEWLWRMMTNPRRLARRYAECALILPGQAIAALRQRG
jgi:N-acetylglucosaminyldiphosphoundecaprenol N-acetyl-beta-D-mannosaminyltransferase